VQPDLDVDGDATRPLDFCGVVLHRRLHGQGGVAGPDTMILIDDRRAEQGHNAVAHDLVHRALVAVHRIHHQREDRIEAVARFLGSTVGEQCQRALDIGEQHADRRALPFQGTSGGENVLGQVSGCGRLGR
jgi:hypothetical protein